MLFALYALDQLLHRTEVALLAGQLECRRGLLGCGRFDVPAQNFSAKCRQRRQGGAGLARHQQHGPDVGAWEVLDQARQQLQLAFGQGVGIVHDPDLGRVDRLVGFDRLAQGLAGQHFVEAAQQGVGVGRKVDFDAVLGGLLAQAAQQQIQVVVEQGFVGAIKRQAQAFVGQGVGAAVDAHAVGGAENTGVQGGVVGLDLDVHARAPSFSSRLPSGLNCMLWGTLTLGLAWGGFKGDAASRLKT